MKLTIAVAAVFALCSNSFAEDVVWTGFFGGAAAQQNKLINDGTYGGGGRSRQTINSGAGSVSFTVTQLNTEYVAGLNSETLATARAAIEHAIQINGAISAEVWERGVYKGETTYKLNDVFKITVDNGAVKYLKNGSVFYASSLVAAYPVYLNALISTPSAVVAGAKIEYSGAPPPPVPTASPVDTVGPIVPVAAVEAMGGVFAKYEQNFRRYADAHWAFEGSSWEGNYYDRAKIYYVWWARTGNAEYLRRANAIALDYRVNYLEANNYGTSAHWALMAGMLLHYQVTGDDNSRKALAAVADNFAAPYYMDSLTTTDQRVQARMLTSFLYAWEAKAVSVGVPWIQPNGDDWGVPGGNDWPTLLRTTLTKILASQKADGSYSVAAHCGAHTPFMTALVNDAMIEYYAKFEKDPRILPSIKKSVDHLWTYNWIPAAQAFKYLSKPCGVNGGTEPAPDLNNLHLAAFGWVYKMTGNAVYKSRGDAILAGGVAGAWLDGGKQFNESYTNSYKYFGYRGTK